jgi:hypothetical protein
MAIRWGMKFRVYPEGCGNRAEEIEAPTPLDAARIYAEEASLETYKGHTLMVQPVDNEAGALGGWKVDNEPDGNGLYLAFEVRAHVEWTAEPE